ncbi:MAG: hypothetical protein KDD70_04925 [Bdellovibrionales bacterium]|nr:hypothetical protein [Bdellovibrionales bacterium]
MRTLLEKLDLIPVEKDGVVGKLVHEEQVRLFCHHNRAAPIGNALCAILVGISAWEQDVELFLSIWIALSIGVSGYRILLRRSVERELSVDRSTEHAAKLTFAVGLSALLWSMFVIGITPHETSEQLITQLVIFSGVAAGAAASTSVILGAGLILITLLLGPIPLTFLFNENTPWHLTVALMAFLPFLIVTAIRMSKNYRSIAFTTKERKTLLDQLTEAAKTAEVAQRVKGEFLANMSHEIRTPMNGVLGMLTLAIESNDFQEAKEYLSISRESAESLLVILEDFLEFSNLEAGVIAIQNEPLDLSEQIEKVLYLFTDQLRQKGITSEITIATSVPTQVVGDALRLRQVLFNLIGNAVKFSNPGGAIQIRISREEDDSCYVLEVQDHGIGISNDQLEAIFNEFHQADSSSMRNYGGTGLGLAICKRLVTAMGGVIEVQSIEGKGSTFRVKVPLRSETRIQMIEDLGESPEDSTLPAREM